MSAIKNISLFIPHVYGNYTSSMVSDVFDDMNIGLVKNVDFVSKMGSDGKPYNAAYIHFYEWHNTVVARNLQERVLNPDKEARVMYDDPWYWIVLENKGKKHMPGDRKPRIDLDAFTGSNVKHSGFDCGHTPAKSKSELEAKPNNYLTQIKIQNAPQKAKTWSQAVHPPTPVNLENEFEAAANEEITQEEMDWAYEQMEIQRERDNENLISIDGRYVQSLEEENEMLRSQMAYFQNLYQIELIKTQTLADTIKNMKA